MKTRNPGYRPGQHWVQCDVCGFNYRLNEVRERWDGLVVCRKDFERRHPQDFVRAKADDSSAKGLVRQEKVGTEAAVCSAIGRDARVGNAIVGCSVVGLKVEF
jgi:hypothetical protein